MAGDGQKLHVSTKRYQLGMLPKSDDAISEHSTFVLLTLFTSASQINAQKPMKERGSRGGGGIMKGNAEAFVHRGRQCMPLLQQHMGCDG